MHVLLEQPLLTILVLGYAFACAACFLERAGWPFEFFAHFRPHLLVGGVLVGLLATGLGAWAHAGAAVALAALVALTVRPFAFVTPTPGSLDSDKLTLVWANIWHNANAARRTLAYARQHGADIVLLGEYHRLDASDPAIIEGFPHRFDTEVTTPAGEPETRILVLSRRPLLSPRLIAVKGAGGRPVVAFETETRDGRVLQVIAIHPSAPMSPRLLAQRDALLGALKDIVRAPFILAGDFNATPWCVGYRLAPGARIGDPRSESTWITRLPLIGLPIDHFKVSPDITAHHYAVAGALGSDHRALLTRISLKPPA